MSEIRRISFLPELRLEQQELELPRPELGEEGLALDVQPEVIENEPPLGPEDRSLWEGGMHAYWPQTPEEESPWLEEVNGLVERGSRDSKSISEDSRSKIHDARDKFFRRLAVGRPDIVERLYENRKKKAGYAYLPRPGTAIGAMRILHDRGVDFFKLISMNPVVISLSKNAISERLDNLEALGIDFNYALKRGGGGLLTSSPNTIQAQLQPIYAAARAFGWGADYKAQALKIVRERPNILTHKADKTRLLARIAVSTFEQRDAQATSAGEIHSLYRKSPEYAILAYARYGPVIRGLKGLLHHMYYYERALDIEAAQGELLRREDEFKDDPVYKIWKRAYPVDDPETAETARQRHVNAREWRERAWRERFDRGVEALAKNLLETTIDGREITGEQAYMEAAREAPTLDAAQEKGLAKLIKSGHVAFARLHRDSKGGLAPEEQERYRETWREGRQARNDLVRANLGVVITIAKGYRRALRYGSLDVVDLIQAGNIGLVLAAEDFDPSKENGKTFEEHAKWRVLNEIRKEFASQSRTIRLPQELRTRTNKLFKARRDLSLELGREPSAVELAEAMGETVQQLNRLQQEARSVVSLDGAVNDSDSTLGDFLAVDRRSDPAVMQVKDSFYRAVHDAVDSLPFMWATVLKMRFFEDSSVEDVAATLGERPEVVRRLEKEALARLRMRKGVQLGQELAATRSLEA